MYTVLYLLRVLFSLYSICLIVRMFLEMMLDPYHQVVVVLRAITEPVLAPIRRIVPPVRGRGVAWDLSPVVALVLLWVIERLLILVLTSLA